MLWSDSGNRMYKVTITRMISGLVLKKRKGKRLVIPKDSRSAITAQNKVPLTTPAQRCSLTAKVLRERVTVHGRGFLLLIDAFVMDPNVADFWAEPVQRVSLVPDTIEPNRFHSGERRCDRA